MRRCALLHPLAGLTMSHTKPGTTQSRLRRRHSTDVGGDPRAQQLQAVCLPAPHADTRCSAIAAMTGVNSSENVRLRNHLLHKLVPSALATLQIVTNLSSGTSKNSQTPREASKPAEKLIAAVLLNVFLALCRDAGAVTSHRAGPDHGNQE